jgi:signal transduction histidine kinase
MLKRQVSLPSLFQDVALLTVSVVVLVDLYLNQGSWLLAAVLFLALLVIYHAWSRRYNTLYLVIEFLVCAALVYLHPLSFILGFSVAAGAMLSFPPQRGVLWIGVFALYILALVALQDGLLMGVFQGMMVFIGYTSFGYAYYARSQAERERKISQDLLEELQEAHLQLKDYAAGIEQLAISEERNRLAREMHDTLGHRLTVAAVQLEGAQRLIPTDPQRAARMLGTVREQVSEALGELRQTVTALRTPLEVDLPLEFSLERLAKSFQAATALPVLINLETGLSQQAGRISLAQRLAVYRTAQEALTNVQRHTHADQVWLDCTLENDCLVLSVRDDGAGIDPQALRPGYGLRGLEERAAQLGGSLQIDNPAGGGAMLRLSLPLAESLELEGAGST